MTVIDWLKSCFTTPQMQMTGAQSLVLTIVVFGLIYGIGFGTVTAWAAVKDWRERRRRIGSRGRGPMSGIGKALGSALGETFGGKRKG